MSGCQLYFNTPISSAGPLESHQQTGATCYKNLVLDRETNIANVFGAREDAKARHVANRAEEGN
jgi:hypothetical protein